MSTRNNFIDNSGKQLDISYNALNLPRTVDNGANGKMQFVYNTAGQKLRTTLYDSPSNITDTSDYIGNFIYKNGQLSYILMPEGRILPNGSSFTYEYHLKDQLGNTHATYIAGANGNATLTQTTAYYPFGLPINALSRNLENNPYLYNGKELHSELNLDLFDYGARFYDAQVGRWWSVDPLTEKRNSVSPYNYTQNNPILRIDPNGALDNPIYDKKGEFLGTDDKGLQGEAIIMDKEDFTQGMAHQKAMSVGNTLDNMSWGDALKFANNGNFKNFLNHYNNLPNRIDYSTDFVLTKEIADKHWQNGGGTLYVNMANINLPDVTTANFDKNGYYSKNFIWGMSNTGKVYGTLDMTLLNPNTGAVKLGYLNPHVSPNGFVMDRYDFTYDGRLLRDFATWYGKPSGNGVNFDIHGYGHATIPVIK